MQKTNTITSIASPSTSVRRDWLTRLGSGLGAIACSTLLHKHASGAWYSQEGKQGPEGKQGSEGKLGLHHAPKAKHVIEIFCPGGLSHVDTWDYKPELERLHGTPFDAELGKQTFAGVAGTHAKSFWPFQQRGQSGLWISDLFPQLSRCADNLAFIHSMQSKSALHGPAMFMMNSGFIQPGFPSMGSWVTYALGSETDNLPEFVVLPDTRGLPPGGTINWGAGFLPAVHQGTVMQTGGSQEVIRDLFPARPINPDDEEKGMKLLQLWNRQHASNRESDSLLEARIASFELAGKLQLSAPEAVNIGNETAATQSRYGLEDPDIGLFGKQCLLARRLVERGVRFVQIYCGAENTSQKAIRPNWDSHEDIVRDHGYWGRILDTGASALLEDLKARGLLESTLVICTSEFGRQPFMQGSQKGRDHNPGAFTAWLAGGGVRGGMSYGSSDAIGFKAAEKPTYCYDLHATALHLLGIDHERLTFYHNGIERRLTDVHGHVIHELIA
jgi:hypothetical protein